MTQAIQRGRTRPFTGMLDVVLPPPQDPAQQWVAGQLEGWVARSEKTICQQYGLCATGTLRLPVELGIPGNTRGVIARVAHQDGHNPVMQLEMKHFSPDSEMTSGEKEGIFRHELMHFMMIATTDWMKNADRPKWFTEGVAEFARGADDEVAEAVKHPAGALLLARALADDDATEVDYTASYVAVRYLHHQIKAAGGAGIRDMMDHLRAHPGDGLDDVFASAVAVRGGPVADYTSARQFLADFAAHGAAFIEQEMDLTDFDNGRIGGRNAEFGKSGGAATTTAARQAEKPRDLLAEWKAKLSTPPYNQFAAQALAVLHRDREAGRALHGVPDYGARLQAWRGAFEKPPAGHAEAQVKTAMTQDLLRLHQGNPALLDQLVANAPSYLPGAVKHIQRQEQAAGQAAQAWRSALTQPMVDRLMPGLAFLHQLRFFQLRRDGPDAPMNFDRKFDQASRHPGINPALKKSIADMQALSQAQPGVFLQVVRNPQAYFPKDIQPYIEAHQKRATPPAGS